MALLALTLLVTSPFLYCFSRLAILEPMLIALTLAALNLAIRLPGCAGRLGIGLHRPALHPDDAHQDHRHLSAPGAGLGHGAAALAESQNRAVGAAPCERCSLPPPAPSPSPLACGWRWSSAWASTPTTSTSSSSIPTPSPRNSIGRWSASGGPFMAGCGWTISSFRWPGLVFLGAAVGAAILARSAAWGRNLLLDPVFGASILAVAGYIFFMTYQNHPQPRYLPVVAFFSFLRDGAGSRPLLDQPAPTDRSHRGRWTGPNSSGCHLPGRRRRRR